jgi:hypothetical protein
MTADVKIGQYAAYVKQSGEGCDYMIGCGNTLVPLSAETIVDAWEAEWMIDQYGYPSGDIGVDYVVMTKVDGQLSGDGFDAIVDALIPEPEEDPAKTARREQYEKLKREFGS